MNDRFRFRAWDKVCGRMLYNIQEAYDGGCVEDKEGEPVEDYISVCSFASFFPYEGQEENEYIVEQCTGLKDKNGKLIYEGDIVRIFYDHFNGTFTEKEVIGPVTWECGTWVVNNSLLNHAPEYDDMILESSAVEVIGNIHENPELLEMEK